jgi:hypothetical protein
MSEGIRKTVCIQYETGKTKQIEKGGKKVTVPETKLLTVGSAFLNQEDDRWIIQGRFHAIPPAWDGKFVLLDPLPRNNGEPEEGPF